MQKLTQKQKEWLKKARKEDYRKMKNKRDKDPKYIALKEAQKDRRKEAYQDIKRRRDEEKEAQKAEKHKKREKELLKMITTAKDMIRKKNTDI